MPTVTQVLSPFVDFSSVPPDVLDYASDRGTRVHRVCAAIALRVWVPLVDEDCAGYVESFRKWLAFVDEVHAVEEGLFDNDLGFCGHLDIRCTMRGDKLQSVWDLKTPLTEGATWRGQLSAYRHLCEKAGRKIGRQGSIRLKPNGNPPKVTEYTGSYNRDFAAFVAALTAWKYFKGE